jgi:hypothetical protein
MRNESIEARLARTERVLGTLLFYLAAREIIGPEDFGIVMEQLRHAPDNGQPPTTDPHPAAGRAG